MCGALFYDQVVVYEDAIKHNKIYEITNARITPLKPEYKTNESGLDYQMTFNNRTIVQLVDIDDDSAVINYHPISHLPRATDYSEMFDNVGIVLFVEEHSRQVKTSKNKEATVREIVLIDHSTTQPLSISVWDELAEDDCTMLIPTPGKFRTVRLIALRVSKHKGFSMTTSTSTVFIHSPTGENAESLASWMTNHQTALTQLQARLFSVKLPLGAERTNKISALRSKKAKTALQDERHWLDVTIPNAEFHKINAYMGCSKCGKRSSIPPGRTYTCDTCSEPDCTSVPKVTFTFEISDGTGSLLFTAFTTTNENLFRMSAADIFQMKHTDDEQTFTAVQELLHLNSFRVQVGPAAALSINNILQWVVKQVVIDGDDGNASKKEATEKVSAQTETVNTSKELQPKSDSSLNHHAGNKLANPTVPATEAVTNDLAASNVFVDTTNLAETKPSGNADMDLPLAQLTKKKAKKDKAGSPSAHPS
ncbi:replication protein A 70 kDa DNA-binding subunit B-like [Silene latifolia]|uniref:replication protein A 70 kDa DNA-binding subunit B-like n=1 Tax=Silene latifolia TaxID=37657 RepID=UPI003D77ADF2